MLQINALCDLVVQIVDRRWSDARGTGEGLDISEDMLRILVILDRAGVFPF